LQRHGATRHRHAESLFYIECSTQLHNPDDGFHTHDSVNSSANAVTELSIVWLLQFPFDGYDSMTALQCFALRAL
jgi:hypothetical protein